MKTLITLLGILCSMLTGQVYAQNSLPSSNALVLDGTTDYATSTIVEIGSGPFTIEMWVKATNLTTTNAQALVSFDGFAPTLYAKTRSGGGTTGKIGYNLGGDVEITEALALNTWTHVALVKEATLETKIYVNGIAFSAENPELTNSASGIVYIGASSPGQERFIGEIDQVRVYDDAKTAFEIQDEMCSKATGVSGLQLQFNFDENLNTDASGNNHTLNITGTPKAISYAPIGDTAFSSYDIGTGVGNFSLTSTNGVGRFRLTGISGVDGAHIYQVNTNLSSNDKIARDSSMNHHFGVFLVGTGTYNAIYDYTNYTDIANFEIGAQLYTALKHDEEWSQVAFDNEAEKTIEIEQAGSRLFALGFPFVECIEPDTIYLEEDGTYTLDPQEVFLANRGQYTLTDFELDRTAFTCSDIQITRTVQLQVTDTEGNNSACRTQIYTRDTVRPTPICFSEITVTADKNKGIKLDSTFLDNGSNDGCAKVSMRLKPDTLTIEDGDTMDFEVKLIVTDSSGNVDSCLTIVTVQSQNDADRPEARCQDFTATIPTNTPQDTFVIVSATDLDGGSSDDHQIDSIFFLNNGFEQDTFRCDETGENLMKIVVVDTVGLRDTCEAVLTILENVFPTARAEDTMIYLEEGQQTLDILAQWIDDGSFDGCNLASLTVSPNTYTSRGDSVEVNVILRVRDAAGNQSQSGAVITFVDSFSREDVTPPVARCKATLNKTSDNNGLTIITGEELDNGSTDNKQIEELIASPDRFTTTRGETRVEAVQLIVVDTAGNRDTCVTQVTITDGRDATDPEARCKDPFTVTTNNGSVTLTVDQIDNGSTDDREIDSRSINPTSITVGKGESEVVDVTLTVTDAAGNSSTCVTQVTVTDTRDAEAPVANCIGQLTVTANSNNQVTISANQIDNGSTDNEAIANRFVVPSTLSIPNGDTTEHTVQLIVEDNAGNRDTCTTTVTVQSPNDTRPPVAVCANPTIQLGQDGTLDLIPAMFDGGSTDNVGIEDFFINEDQVGCADVGNMIITLSVVDAAGNSSSCQSTFTLIDTSINNISCNSRTVNTETGNVQTASLNLINADLAVCGLASVTYNPTSIETNRGETKQTEVTVTYIDQHSQTRSCVANVTLIDERATEDIEAPEARCQDIIVYLNDNGVVQIEASDIDGGSTDNDEIDTIIASKLLFDCDDIGNNDVELLVIDTNGNRDSCIAEVRVIDSIAPVARVNDVTALTDANGFYQLSMSDFENGSTDNCGIVSRNLSQDEFNVAPGNTEIFMVEYTVSDLLGNEDVAVITLELTNEGRPNAVSKSALDVVLTQDGTANILVEDIDSGSTAVAGIDTMFIQPTTFDCDDVESPVEVTLTVRDNNGHISTSTTLVTVIDADAPVIDCSAMPRFLITNSRIVTIDEPLTHWSVTDNCAVDIELTPSLFELSEDKNEEVFEAVLAATDGSNVETCTVQIILKDTTTSIQPLDPIEYQIKVYPNPVDNGNVTISFAGKADGDGAITITDIVGTVVYQEQLSAVYGAQQVNVPLNVTAGMYIVNLELNQADQKGQFMQRILVK